MLDKAPPISATVVEVQPTVITGRELNRRVRKLSPTGKALFAVDLTTGATQVVNHTERQARLLTGASFGYVNTLLSMSESDRALVKRGWAPLAAAHQRRKSKSVPSDIELVEYVRKVGVARAWDAICTLID
jgi:hypothetical protein